jgi:hypothetical protein
MVAVSVLGVSRLEAKAEPAFHPDPYGHRPGRSALNAGEACRERCWKTDWVIDLDIRKFFDSFWWDLVAKAVEANTDLELVYTQDAELTLFLVEEPEAHLHPQLQAVLLDYLRKQAEHSASGDDSHGPVGRIQIIATTHSPNLASSVGTKNLVVLRTKQDVEQASSLSYNVGPGPGAR